jgi:pyruvate formate lyase activating enzyme
MNKISADPLIFEIKGNSLDDGPGIRTVVFFKGCPLSCVWCHNPESKRREREISFDASKCITCNACLAACTGNALDRKNEYYVLRDRCTLCGTCVDVCPSGALSLVGKEMTVEEIVSAVEKDVPFFNNSGGGVTLSGGDPTLFMDFTARLAAGLKARGVRVLLETCGFFNYDAFMERLYPHLDCVYMDIKIMDPERHRELCGQSNGVILENFRKLNRLYREGGIEILPRVPLIPGLTATKENLSAIAAFLREEGASRVGLLRNNPLWFNKARMLGSGSGPAHDGMRGWITRDAMADIEKHFHGMQIV